MVMGDAYPEKSVISWASEVRGRAGLIRLCHWRPYFLLGRWVRAAAAADFAALLELGLRRTFPAAEAAFALVTSLFALFDFAILITSFRPVILKPFFQGSSRYFWQLGFRP